MRVFLIGGAVNGAIAVAMGAFAAHGLSDAVSAARLGWLETGARYEMAHALALLSVAWMLDRGAGRAARVAGLAFLAGTLLFSGGLYLAGLSGWTGIMPVVPVGGTAFLVGWAALLVAALRRPPG